MDKIRHIFFWLVVFALVFLSSYCGFRLAFRGLIFPKVKVAGVLVAGMDRNSAIGLLTKIFNDNPSEVSLHYLSDEILKINTVKIDHDIVWAVDQAMNVGRNGNILTQVKEEVSALIYGREIVVPVIYSKDEVQEITEIVADRLNREPTWPKIVKDESVFRLEKGNDGVRVVTDKLTESIVSGFSQPGKKEIEIPVTKIVTGEDPQRVEAAISTIVKWDGKRLRLYFRDFEKHLDTGEILGLLGLVNEPIDTNSFASLVEKIRPGVEVEPRDAVFVFEEGRVNEFKPEVVGAVLDIPQFKNKISEVIYSHETDSMEIPVILSQPKIRAGDINNLGIKELLGRGRSQFLHSIPGRVFNVNLAASRINGTLVAPGEEFSFNKAVGDISRATGYQTAYVISQGKTVLGDGGGVCQVSTTVFRASLDAGFPITERKSHAYRVGYYEQDSGPGVDATIFSPSTDFKFLNDTDHHILIQTSVDTKNLTMKVEIFGTSDGRKVTLSKPKISSQSPAPATVYIEDPTLPAGVTKQIDWSAPGAKVSFDYKVEKEGNLMFEKTFYSNYQPWRAVFLKGTGQ